MCEAGVETAMADDGDLPNDRDVCTDDLCDMGAPSHPHSMAGTACNGTGVCDGMGACTECIGPDDCDQLPPDDECQTRTCIANMCGQTFTDGGTPLAIQSPGDCETAVCDGQGGIGSLADDTDLPVDGLQCTEDLCDMGVPDNPPLPADTPCMAGVCNAMGGCVGCNQPDDCGGTPTFCQGITCIGETCGVSNTGLGTPLPPADQTAGDCQVLQCNGLGMSESVVDIDDVPADDGNDCTAEVCTMGAPQHEDEPLGTPCAQNGGNVCDGLGTCVECNVPADCGPAPACQTATCIANQCGTQNQPNLTMCDDGLFCTVTDQCSGGACVGTGSPCLGPDGDGNCAESCDETQNDCAGNDPGGSPCDDGLFCTVTDTCNGNGACTGTGVPCPGIGDGDGNCNEGCNEAMNNCTGAEPFGSPCTDTFFCTQTDVCDGFGSCSGSGDPCAANVGDADDDCTESCNEAANNCTAQDPNLSACDDTLFCTTSSACMGGVCMGTGNPCMLNPNDSDCSQSCNEVSNNCTANDPVGSPCTDTLFCTGVDTCNGMGTCTSPGNPCVLNPNDNDCSQTCNEGADQCNGNDPNGSACEDGLFCTDNDTCQGGNCVGGDDPCQGPDSDTDCTESCDEDADDCQGNDPNNSLCHFSCFPDGVCQNGTCFSGCCGINGCPP
jgi:hypothetical protein